ncbi:MAG: ABC transporter substrate-binding protein [Candidatus Berkelbacteria bacterium]|nr:ABC transporter substrate-binding protein [Candidatus Berkelbacteria bacterium]
MLKVFFIILKRFLSLPKYLTKIEKIIVLGLFGVILISIGLLIYDHTSDHSNSKPRYGGNYIEGEVGEIHHFIPILKQTDAEKDISRLIFSSLIKINKNREVIPDLAEKWEISPDGKVYTFYLRDTRWHNNDKVTADDIVFTFSLISNAKASSPYFDSYKDIEVKKIDDKTVLFTLKSPFAPFLSSLTVPIIPKNLLLNVAPTDLLNSQFAKKPTGSGPYELSQIKKDNNGTSVTLIANKNYYSKKPYILKMGFIVYQHEQDLQNALAQKKVLGVINGQTQGYKSYKINLPQYKAVFLNMDSDVIKYKDLRKALALSTNKQELLNSGISGTQIDYPILPGFLGYKESEKWAFDLEKAKKAYAKVKNPPAELIFLVKDDNGNQQVAEILKKQWEAVGIKINLVLQTNSEYEKTVADRNYDLLLTGVNQKLDPDPYPIWHSSQKNEFGLNFSSYKNPEVDKLLEDARQTMNQNLRKQKYERFVDIIQNDAPAIFLYQPIYNFQVNDIVKGVEDIQGVTKADRFWNIENWYIKK